MRRILALSTACVMASAQLAGCAAAEPGTQTSPPVAAGGPACAPLDDEWDYARVRPEPQKLADARARAEQGHREVRAKAGLEPDPPNGEGVRVFTWGSMLPGRYSLAASRMANGQWEVVRVSEGREGRPAPEAPSVKVARIEGEAAARLARVVENACLYAEPTYYGRTVPTRDGGEAACADGSDQLIEIKVMGRRHVSFHACHTFGRAGQAADMLWQASSD